MTHFSLVSHCIEQSLMAGLKGATGLTRGRGVDEQSRLVWVLSRPAVISIDRIIKEMTGVDYKTFDQHLSTKHVHASTLSRNQKNIGIYIKNILQIKMFT